MILKDYAQVVDHLYKHPKEPLFIHSVDDSIDRVKNVQYNDGLMVLTTDDRWIKVIPTHTIFNNLVEKSVSKKKKKGKKKNELLLESGSKTGKGKKVKNDQRSSESRNIGQSSRCWL